MCLCFFISLPVVAVAGVFSEKGCVLNMCLEGIMSIPFLSELGRSDNFYKSLGRDDMDEKRGKGLLLELPAGF